jgi:hypothetical protein
MNTPDITRMDLYAYALGYYYGRAEGVDHDPFAESEGNCRYFYQQGYEAGVADYCDAEVRS